MTEEIDKWKPVVQTNRPRMDIIGYGDTSGINSFSPSFVVEDEEEIIYIKCEMPKETEPVKIEKNSNKNIIQSIIDWVLNLFK